MIRVQSIDNQTFEVTVESGATTTHRVTVTDAYHQQLTGGEATREELLTASFEFLLEREPNTSILRQFDLPVIASYFPEYESKMRSRFGG